MRGYNFIPSNKPTHIYTTLSNMPFSCSMLVYKWETQTATCLLYSIITNRLWINHLKDTDLEGQNGISLPSDTNRWSPVSLHIIGLGGGECGVNWAETGSLSYSKLLTDKQFVTWPNLVFRVQSRPSVTEGTTQPSETDKTWFDKERSGSALLNGRKNGHICALTRLCMHS